MTCKSMLLGVMLVTIEQSAPPPRYPIFAFAAHPHLSFHDSLRLIGYE